MDNQNYTILVVGNDRPRINPYLFNMFGRYGSYKAATVEALSKCGYKTVIATTDMTDFERGKSLINARRWISNNSLRRLEGQKVKVVCALDKLASYDEDWADTMSLIFEKNSKKGESGPVVAAVIQNKDILSSKHLKKFFGDLDTAFVPEDLEDNCRDLSPLLPQNSNIVLETMNDACAPHLERIIEGLKPFEIKTQPLGLTGKKDVKAWSSEKAILFGRSGSGKSTVAQMLTHGCLKAESRASTTESYASCSSASGSPSTGFMASPLTHVSSSSLESWLKAHDLPSHVSDSPSSRSEVNQSSPGAQAPSPPCTTFESSSNARGMTSNIQRGEGKGWHVTDTPGFGEAKGGTVSTEDATKIIKKFVIDICGIYSHFLYVVKKDRMSTYDDQLWKFFKKIFAGAEDNFTVVVTGCEIDVTAEDKKHLEENVFKGCKNFVYVDFPSMHKNLGIEEENEDVREKSLRDLEDKLSSLGVADKDCWEGEYSREKFRFKRSDIKAKCRGLLNNDVLDAAIAQSYNYLLVRPKDSIAGIFHRSKIDSNVDKLLLPQ